MFTPKEITEIKEYLDNVPEDSKIYLGADSVVYTTLRGVWARYCIVLVIHLAQKHGCKVFSFVDKERIFDQNKKKPSLRLMTEVMKVASTYIELADVLEPFDLEGNVEIHLDLNSDPMHPSNTVVKQALGYIKGVTGLDAKIKPESMIASHCADHKAKYGTFARNNPWH